MKNTIRIAAEIACGTKLAPLSTTTAEIKRLGEELLELDVINDDTDADKFDEVLSYLVNEVGENSADRILRAAYAA